MDWSLYRCGRSGHVTYAPDEPGIREHISASTASAELWQCLRCGSYVVGPPHGSGAVADAPVIRRDREIRGDILLKLFAIERGFRVLLFAAVAFGIWSFAGSKDSLTQAINKELPIIRSLFSQLGFTLNHSLLDRLHSLLHVSTSNLHLIALGIAGLAVVSGIEAFALWQAKRWGEYFATIVTSLGLPFEVYEIAKAVTPTKAVLFLLNLLLVFYLVYSRRLFGARGGKEAYENRLRQDSVLDDAAKAAEAIRLATERLEADRLEAERLAAPGATPAGPAAAGSPSGPTPAVHAGPPPAPATIPMGASGPREGDPPGSAGLSPRSINEVIPLWGQDP